MNTSGMVVRITVGWRKLSQLVGEHAVVAQLLLLFSAIIAWIRANRLEAILAVLAAALATYLVLRFKEQLTTPKQEAAALSGEGDSTLGTHPGADDAGTSVTLKESTMLALLTCAASAGGRRGTSVDEVLSLLARDVRQHHGGQLDIRVEVLVYSRRQKSLRLRWSSGLPPTAKRRSYPIRGHTPGGGTSAAGTAWATNRPVVIADINTDPKAHQFDDDADARCGPTRSLICVPIPRLGGSSDVPAAIVAISAVLPGQFFEHDLSITKCFAQAVAYRIHPSGKQAA